MLKKVKSRTNLALEKMLIVPHGVAVGQGSHLKANHFITYRFLRTKAFDYLIF